MDAFAGRIEVMWLLMGALAVVCAGGFMPLRTRVDKEIDKSSGVTRVYPGMQRQPLFFGLPPAPPNRIKNMRKQR